ncbi:protein ALP1-like [Sceloporus undulatus]|uniref:protein ALP1-like n=1 Tax=Sceloporus undulatus TaxID=8520 RepID=UPI001C4D2E75|nr:protein ALP1-like [Sceloporus undulatus]
MGRLEPRCFSDALDRQVRDAGGGSGKEAAPERAALPAAVSIRGRPGPPPRPTCCTPAAGGQEQRLAYLANVPEPRRWWVKHQAARRNWLCRRRCWLLGRGAFRAGVQDAQADAAALADALRPHLRAQDTTMRRAITVEERVPSGLVALQPAPLPEVARRFQIGLSTASVICIEVAQAIEKVLLRRTVRLGDHRQIMDGFEKLGFPNCVGAVHGIHIPVRAPKVGGEDYYNKKHGYSIVLQGATDHNGRFINIEAGFPGRNHESFIFQHSFLCQAMDAGAFVPGNPTITINGVQVPPLIIADGEYPMRKWLMKPYGGTVRCQQLKFNTALRSAHSVVERAFGRLKSRWGCLGAKLSVGEQHFATVVSACVVLHNICETSGAVLHTADESVEELRLPAMQGDFQNDINGCKKEGETVRAAIARMLDHQ